MHVDTVVPGCPENSLFPVWTDDNRGEVRAKLGMPELTDAFCDEQLDQAYFSATGIRIVSGKGASAGGGVGNEIGGQTDFRSRSPACATESAT